MALLGPAFVAAVAYIDPGNFATNFAAGARFGYTLAWVIVAANLMAMLVQYLSAKIGVATGRDLPELCRDQLPRAVSAGLWVQAELIAMATDLAEFIGAALGLNLIFGVRLLPAGLITAVVAFGILALQQRGYRRFELAICGLLGIVFLGFAYDLVAVGTDPGAIAAGLVPSLPGGSLLLVAGIIGATVMPHVVYLHSALTKSRVHCRDDAERLELMRFQRLDVLIALGAAGLINLAMLFVAAALFSHAGGYAGADSIQAAHFQLGRLVGGGAALAFAVALLASGLSSSSVGTYAGQVVMQGFIGRRIPLYIRRGLTMLPALIVLGARAAHHRQPGDLAGGAVVRHPVRAGAAGAGHPPGGHHGRAGQPPRDHAGDVRHRRADHRHEHVPALDHVRLTPPRHQRVVNARVRRVGWRLSSH